MSSTITLVIPWAEKESVFLQRAVQAAIRAHRITLGVTISWRTLSTTTAVKSFIALYKTHRFLGSDILLFT